MSPSLWYKIQATGSDIPVYRNIEASVRISDFKGLRTQGKLKVKCTLVQALKLCTRRTARRRSRVIALLFLDHGTRRGLGVSVTPRPLFTSGKDPVPILQEAGWAPGSENLVPTGIRSRTPQHVVSRYTDYATRPSFKWH